MSDLRMTVLKQFDMETGQTISRVDPFLPHHGMRADLREQKAQLIAYCQMKIKTNDWHGVADVAMDIREIDAKLELLGTLFQD